MAALVGPLGGGPLPDYLQYIEKLQNAPSDYGAITPAQAAAAIAGGQGTTAPAGSITNYGSAGDSSALLSLISGIETASTPALLLYAGGAVLLVALIGKVL
jgi:hypothetical protein